MMRERGGFRAGQLKGEYGRRCAVSGLMLHEIMQWTSSARSNSYSVAYTDREPYLAGSLPLNRYPNPMR